MVQRYNKICENSNQMQFHLEYFVSFYRYFCLPEFIALWNYPFGKWFWCFKIRGSCFSLQGVIQLNFTTEPEGVFITTQIFSNCNYNYQANVTIGLECVNCSLFLTSLRLQCTMWIWLGIFSKSISLLTAICFVFFVGFEPACSK